MILVLKRFLPDLKKVLVPFSLREQTERHGSTVNWGGLLGPSPSRITFIVTFWREGQHINRHLLLTLSPTQERRLSVETKMLLNKLFVSPLLCIFSLCFTLAPSDCISFFSWVHIFFSFSSTSVSLLFPLCISFTVFFTNLFLCTLITFHLFFVPEFTSAPAFDWSRLLFPVPRNTEAAAPFVLFCFPFPNIPSIPSLSSTQ